MIQKYKRFSYLEFVIMNKSFNLYNYLKLQAMEMTFCLSKQQKIIID